MRTVPWPIAFAITCLACLQLAAAQTASQSAKAPARKPAAGSSTAKSTASTAAAKGSATSTAPAPCNCPPAVQQRHLPPYVAKQETTRVQTLADGTTITTVTENLIARDADGRTRNEITRTLPDGTQVHSVNISDPVARLQLSWTDNMPTNATRIVNVFHYPQPVNPTQPVAQPLPAAPPPAQRYYPYKTESLPPQTIAGIYATGTRTTRTTPAGYIGNDRDISVVTENWYSQELGLQLRSIMDDPRTGRSTTEVTDVQRTAPDPALFQPPAGFTLHENNQ